MTRDDAVIGEAAGIAMGLVMIGTHSSMALEDMINVCGLGGEGVCVCVWVGGEGVCVCVGWGVRMCEGEKNDRQYTMSLLLSCFQW